MNDNNNLNNTENPAELHRKKRERIKTILIVFLIILLIFTFFSNTIMNKSLPEVATERCTSGNLTEKLRGNGIIESNQAFEVTAGTNQVVETVNIKKGSAVEKDDVLFVLTTEENEALKEAEETLAALQLDYQTSLLTLPADYTSENLDIKAAREDLQTLINKKQSAYVQVNNKNAKSDRLREVTSQLTSKTSELTKYNGYVLAIDTDDYSSLSVNDSGTLYSLAAQVENAENTLADAKAELEALKDSDNTEKISAAEEKVSSAQNQLQTAKDNLSNQKSSLRSSFAQKIPALENSVNALTAESESLTSEIEASETASPDEIQEQITEAQRNLEKLVTELEATKKQDSVDQQVENLNITSKREAVEKQQAVVDKLKEKSGTVEVKAKYSGVISEVNVKIGDTTTPDFPLAVIDISAEGYTLKMSVPSEKVKKIKVGAEADVLNSWSGEINAVLTGIKNDPEDKKSKVLTFDITGDAESGDMLELSIPCGTANYDAIVPKTAVFEDNEGKFVLTLASKSTPLGNRYYARRHNVEVLASDDKSSAVSGDISSGDYIISTASKPVKPNAQVRTKD